MADLTITAANVVAASNATRVTGTAGETITAGQPVYAKSSDSYHLWKCDANFSADTAAAVGIALHAASDGQPLTYITAGDVDLGATLVEGTVYVVSATAGGIAPAADLTTGWYTTVLGVATTSSNLAMQLQVSGAAAP